MPHFCIGAVATAGMVSEYDSEIAYVILPAMQKATSFKINHGVITANHEQIFEVAMLSRALYITFARWYEENLGPRVMTLANAVLEHEKTRPVPTDITQHPRNVYLTDAERDKDTLLVPAYIDPEFMLSLAKTFTPDLAEMLRDSILIKSPLQPHTSAPVLSILARWGAES